MLSGKASLHIDLAALDDPDKVDGVEGHEVTTDADKWEEVWDRSGKRYLRLDRSKFGGYITSFGLLYSYRHAVHKFYRKIY